MKTNTIKDIVLLGTFAGFAYYISRYYRQQKAAFKTRHQKELPETKTYEELQKNKSE